MKLEDQLRQALRRKHYSYKTEESYVGWYKRYVLWHKERSGQAVHPAELGAADVEAFLTHLAVNRGVAAVTQNQALNALVFLYRETLKQDLGGLNALRAKHHKRLPVVLTQEEVAALLRAVSGEWFWMFPPYSISTDPRTGTLRRHHLHEINISRELARACQLAQIEKRGTAHTLRHSFATHLILRGVWN